jgi:hypothetical protein
MPHRACDVEDHAYDDADDPDAPQDSELGQQRSNDQQEDAEENHEVS